MIITIDGGSATGKTTVATALSERFEIPLLESGSLYRALVFKALQEKISIEDTESVKAFVSKADLKMSLLHRKWLLLVNDDLIKPEDLRQLDVTIQLPP